MRYPIISILLLTGTLAVLIVAPARAAEFIAVTNNAPPLKYVRDGVIGGISGDILTELMERTGHTFTSIPTPVPLEDSLPLARRTPGYICVGLVKTPNRAPFFKWVGPYYTFATGIVVKKSRNFSIARLEDAKGMVLASVINSAPEKKYGTTVLDPKQLKRFPTTREALLALTGDAVDGLLMPTAPAYHLMVELGFEPSEYVTAITLENQELNFAFHHKTDDTVIQAFQRQLEAMKQTDETGMSPYLKIISRHSARSF